MSLVEHERSLRLQHVEQISRLTFRLIFVNISNEQTRLVCLLLIQMKRRGYPRCCRKKESRLSRCNDYVNAGK